MGEVERKGFFMTGRATIVAIIFILILYAPLKFAEKRGALKRLPFWQDAIFFLSGGVFLFLLTFILGVIVQLFHIPLAGNSLSDVQNFEETVITILSSCFFAPIYEETLCRYGLISFFEWIERKTGRTNVYACNIILSSIIFGLLHLPGGGSIVQAAYASFSGLILGFLFLGRKEEYMKGFLKKEECSKEQESDKVESVCDSEQKKKHWFSSMLSGKNLLRDVLFHMGFNTTSVIVTLVTVNFIKM